MKNEKIFAVALTLLLLGGVAAQAQTAVPYDLEFGYRKTTVDGNEQMYRSQINERSGFLLRSLTLETSDFGGTTGAFDRFRIDASDMGAGPAGAFRLEASKAEAYRFTLGYRHAEVYSALPAFANPLLSQGILPGQHTWDRTRNMFDIDVELTRWKMFTPFVGWSSNNMTGPGTTTYHQGGDEFLLSQSLDDREREWRVGTGFNFGQTVYGSITQGWRKVRATETLSLVGPQTGNSTTPVLGRDPKATLVTRNDASEIKTPFTNFYATAALGKRFQVTGNYVTLSADSKGGEDELLTGSFVTFGINRFFTGLTETASHASKEKTWRGGGRLEMAILPGLDGFVGYQQDHRDLTGTALINTLYTGTTNFVGLDPRDVATVLNAESGMLRKEKMMNVGLSSRAGPFSVRAEYRKAQQDAEVAPDLSEIVVPGNQEGTFERNISTVDINAAFTKAGFTLGAAMRRDTADDPIFRTDYANRDRYRLRAAYQAPKWVRLGVTAEDLKQENPQTGIQSDGKVKQYSGDIEITPIKTLALRASASKFKADNSIVVRRPENFVLGTSVYMEEGKAKEGGIMLTISPVSLDASFSKFENRGDNPFDMNRARVRVGMDIPKTKAGVVFEYAKDKYEELNPLFGSYDAKRLGFYLRLHM